MRSITQIANDMDRIAKRRADVNRLHGSKLIAYKTLEVELAEAQAAADKTQPSLYLKTAERLLAEIAALKATR